MFRYRYSNSICWRNEKITQIIQPHLNHRSVISQFQCTVTKLLLEKPFQHRSIHTNQNYSSSRELSRNNQQSVCELKAPHHHPFLSTSLSSSRILPVHSYIWRDNKLLFSNEVSDKERRSNLIGMTFFTFCALFVFTLSYWQLKRKQWKEELIAFRSNKIHNLPVSLTECLARSENWDDINFTPVIIQGKPHYNKQMLLGPRNGGFFVITPFTTVDGLEMLVNRGWIPSKEENLVLPEQADENGNVQIVAVPREGEQFSAVVLGTSQSQYDDVKRKRVFLDLNEIAKELNMESFAWTKLTNASQETAKLLPPLLVVDVLEPTGSRTPERKPREKYLTTSVSPQRHLEYAVFWSFVAVAILGLGYVRFLRPLQPAKVKKMIQK